MHDAEAFFQLLEKFDQHGMLADFDEFSRCLQKLFANNDAVESNVHVMTIHKSKGLEFDQVIVPGLSRRVAPDSSPLFRWHRHHDDQLLIAPIKARHEDFDPIYQYLQFKEKTRGQYEQARLLYVALTRARSQLHLSYCLAEKPVESSPLSLLWKVLGDDLAQQHVISHQQIDDGEADLRLQRLPSTKPKIDSIEYQKIIDLSSITNVANQQAKALGTLCHRLLQQIAEEGADTWSAEKIQAALPLWEANLRAAGITDVDSALHKLSHAITNTLADGIGQWLLSRQSDAHCEYELSCLRDEVIQTFIIDRTFVDEHGVRWIIDYKTAEPDGDNVDKFLAEQCDLYQRQLENYGRLFAELEQREIRLCLYFPMIQLAHSWGYKVNRTSITAGNF